MSVKPHNQQAMDYLIKLLGREVNAFLSSQPEPGAVRLNTLRTTSAEFLSRLSQLQVPYKKIPFSDLGFIIPKDTLPLSHTLDFFLGKIQYQGISSQLPAIVLNPRPGETVLDMAAAPGSKSTQMAALMQNQGRLFLNDISRKRIQALNANTQKAGVLNQILLNYPGERFGNFFPRHFDKILLDAPCTALGTIASSPEILGWWSLEKLKKLCAIQERLFISAVKALKVGGELVYSTCSIAPEENEMLIQKMLEIYPLEILAIDLPGIEKFEPGLTSYGKLKFNPHFSRALRVYPHVHKMEGFFVVRLRKTDGSVLHQGWKKMAFIKTLSAGDPQIKDDLSAISETYGIPVALWQNYRYLRTQKRLWMTNQENEEIPEQGFASIGLLIAEKKQFMWKLFNQSAQFFGEQIQHRRLGLNRDQMLELFATARLALPGVANGYFVIEWQGKVIGSIYVENEKGQMRLPHKFRLVL